MAADGVGLPGFYGQGIEGGSGGGPEDTKRGPDADSHESSWVGLTCLIATPLKKEH